MLTFLSGTDIRQKKEYISGLLCESLNAGDNVYLLVPEQSLFERERELLFLFGAEKSDKINITSFTKLTSSVLEEYSLNVKPAADDTARYCFMSLACEEVSDSLTVYSKYYSRAPLIKELMAAYSEIKTANLGTDALNKVSKSLPAGLLKKKTDELSRIFSAYEALITERFTESTDNIRVFTEFLRTHKIFGNAVFIVDDFRGFTGEQLALLGEIMAGSGHIYISVTAYGDIYKDNCDAFSHTVRNVRALKSIADINGTATEVTEIPDREEYSALSVLRNSVYSIEPEVFEEKTDSLTVISADNKYDECEYAALEIKTLLEKHDYRCRDIAVTERGSAYVKPLISALKKYGIPVFEDKRRPLSEYPLVRLILAAAEIAVKNFSTELVLNYIKTGIAGIDENEIADIENYVYLWQIDYGSWLKDFTGNPRGFGEKADDDTEKALGRLNSIRKKIVMPLCEFTDTLNENSGELSSAAVWTLLKNTHAAENFREYAVTLDNEGNTAEALECSRAWDEAMNALDALHGVLQNRRTTPARFSELLKIILCASDLGNIPGGIDEITVGSADRMRLINPRAVFILGANDGVFPEKREPGGLFTSAERRTLADNSFMLESLTQNIYAEERLIAYSAVNSASERLYIFCSRRTLEGEALERSEIIDMVNSAVPECRRINASDISDEEKIGSISTAFEICAENIHENTVFAASLKKAVAQVSPQNFSALENSAHRLPRSFEEKELARKLFGDDMRLSPSRIETYAKCPFMYFCRYGMKVNQLKSASLDARINGLLVHHVLEIMLSRYTNAELTKMSPDEITARIDEITEGYIESDMGGRAQMNFTVSRQIDRVKANIGEILMRLISEFGTSSFVTVDVELEISEKGVIKPYTLSLQDGGSITLGGLVDRVDVMSDEGKAYVRIIDYKTGGKSFRLSDVFYGLNMQMLVYLMCLWDNGGERYGDVVPAGILYVPAKSGGKMLSRNASPEDILKQKLENGRMNGILLESEGVLKGMESAAEGRYINASIDKNGKLKGSFVSLNNFALLHTRIDDIIKDAGMKMHSGKFEAVPVLSGDYAKTCAYCDYASVCRREENDPEREIVLLSHNDAISELASGTEVTQNV